MDFTPKMQGQFNKQKSVNVFHHIKKLKKKTTHDHLRYRKASDKIQHYFTMKLLERLRIKGEFLNMIKTVYSKPIGNIKLMERNSKQFH